MNFVIDAVVQPVLNSGIEVALWSAMIAGMGLTTLGGFPREYYLAYALWATFVGRLTSNWMYEFNMIDEIETGKVNALLTRPISFYEFYLSQFFGYKAACMLASFVIPFAVCLVFKAPFHVDRVPMMLAMIALYLVFTHTLSFCVACLAFHLNRAQALTGIKNMAIWVLAGELIPLDLYPEPFKSFLLNSPFAAAVYLPVGYITGRFGPDLMIHGFMGLTVGLVVAGMIAAMLWRNGVRAYTGTGA